MSRIQTQRSLPSPSEQSRLVEFLNWLGQPRRLFRILAAGACAFALWFWGFRSPRWDLVNFPPTASGPWMAFGDSLTAGQGATPGHDYPTVLGQRLGVEILNLGHSGDTTADGLRRLDAALELHPRVVLLCLGGNDSLQRVPVGEVAANLRRIIQRFQQGGALVVLIGVRSATVRDQNAKAFRRLAREEGAFYVPNIFKGILLKPIYMSDALHPNDAGYRLIAERLARELQPLLPTLCP